MKFDVEPSPDYMEHVSEVHSDINKQLPSNILKFDDGDINMDDIVLDSAEVKGLQSIDVSQSRNDFKSCNLPDNINNYKNESGCRNSPRLGATTDVKDICIDECPLTTEIHRSLGEILQGNNGDREIAGPSNEYHAVQDYSGSLIDERRRLDTTERIACTPPSEETTELRSRNFEEFQADSGSTAENQDLGRIIEQVSVEEEKDSTNMISMRPFGEDVAASTSDLEAEGTSIVGNKNKVLNYQLSFQSQNGDVGTEDVTGSGDGTISARTSFARPVHGDSDLFGPHLHGTIATSTQIPYSGSTSFQSESSTTSTRSFAFPKLQAEWNSSPVRMAKAKRRRLKKLHEWKSKLLCCKF